MSELTAKQELFCQEYLIDLNATKAAERAGFSKKSASVQSWQMLRKPHIQARVSELLQDRLKRVEQESDQVLVRLDQIGGIDIAECFTETGAFKNIHEIPKELRQCISSIDVFEEYDMVGGKKVKIGETTRLKFWDKIRANELVGKHRKLFIDKVDHTHRVGTLEDLVAGSVVEESNKQIKGEKK